jgi:signal transduction histidine kinase
MTSIPMDATSEPADANAARLRQLIRANEPAAPLTALAILLLYLLLYRAPILIVLEVGLLFTVVAQRFASHYARINRIAVAITALVIGVWCQTVTTGIFAPRLWPLTAVFSILAVVIALPFVTGKHLLRLIFGATGILAVGATFAYFNPLITLKPLPDTLLNVLVPVGTLVGAVLCMLSIWQSGARMQETIDDTMTANEALRESERTLERKVEARTAELAVARDEALNASRAKSDFLANMSHELRTPLNAIIGYSELIEEEAAERGDSYMLDIGRIASSGRYLLSLINGVLDLSKIEAGKMDVQVEDFDLDDLLREVEGTIGPLVKQNSNRLEVLKPGPLGTMRSDPTKVRQVLLNLLSNACKFTREGVISVTASDDRDDSAELVVFAIRDTGVGMTPVQLERVFDAFVQAEDSTARDFGGTGLGLSITRQFCEILGGSIDARSQAGVGSTFTVLLPRDKTRKSNGRAPVLTMPSGAKADGPD